MDSSVAERAEFRRHVGPLLAAAAVEIAAIDDPGTRELAAASLLPGALLDGPDGFLSEAIDVVAAAPHGPELLAAMAVAAPTPMAVRARVALGELDAAPPRLGRLEIVEAWAMEADEPVSALFLLCRREHAQGAQLFSFTIDARAGPAGVICSLVDLPAALSAQVALEIAALHAAIVRCSCSRSRRSSSAAGSGESISRSASMTFARASARVWP